MLKLWLVMKREYKTRVVAKGFVISTIAIPVLLVGMVFFEAKISSGGPGQAFKLAVLDESGTLGRLVGENLAAEQRSGGKPEFVIDAEPGLPRSLAAARSRLDELTRSGSLDGYLWIPAGVATGEAQPELFERSENLLQSKYAIEQAISEAVIAGRLQAYGVAPAHVESLIDPVSLKTMHLNATRGQSEDNGQGYAIAVIMAMILYFALLMYGIITMRSILEEKSTHTMEVLISSVRPFELMAGKILGVAAVGLTQFLIWAVTAGLLAAYGLSMAHAFSPGAAGLNFHIPTVALICFVLYFIGGYFLFASLYAAIGAAVSDHNDAQQIQMPVTLLLVAGIILLGVVGRDPYSTEAVVLTMIPFFSPVLMVFRVAMSNPPLWQIALSIGILAATCVGVVYVTGRIYRVGVLMYGKRPSLVELFKWIRYS